jgi:hypothetical protein
MSDRVNMIKMKCVNQRFGLGFKPERKVYKMAYKNKREKMMVEIRGMSQMKK